MSLRINDVAPDFTAQTSLPLKPEAREAIQQRMKAVHARAAAAKEPPPALKEPPEPKFTKAQEPGFRSEAQRG